MTHQQVSRRNQQSKSDMPDFQSEGQFTDLGCSPSTAPARHPNCSDNAFAFHITRQKPHQEPNRKLFVHSRTCLTSN
jgi:hypothetical protein